jgi:hypothetical protein
MGYKPIAKPFGVLRNCVVLELNQLVLIDCAACILQTGTPGQIRTPNQQFLKLAALPISVRGQNKFRSSGGHPPHENPHNPVGLQRGHTAFHVLVRPPGIEPGSCALQAPAITISAKDANFGIPPRIRTLSSGFGDRCAAVDTREIKFKNHCPGFPPRHFNR